MSGVLSRRIAMWVLWTLTLVGVTLFLLWLRSHGEVDQVHAVLIYLLLVLGASASGGRALGFTLACVAFVLLDYLFQRPYDFLSVSGAGDALVLFAFLCTAGVTTQLLAKATAAVTVARHKADEVTALAQERVRLIAAAEHAEALREADRLKDIVLASVSHDLRTPLTTIKALAQESGRRGEANAAVIEEQADRLSRLVSDLLDLSRMQGRAFHIEPETNSAEDVIGAAMRQCAGLPNKPALRVMIDRQEPALYGRFDFVQTLRVLTNLLENAARFSPQGEVVDIGVVRAGEQLRFTVSDRGPGIALEERDRVFEPFYRGRLGRNDVSGSGLGLSIAKHLAELQGGSVAFAPRAGGGSQFTLSIPAVDQLG